MNEENARAIVLGYEAGEASERERILKWIEKNRSGVEIEDGVFMYRDHFSSESLIAFIKGELDE
jgi:hypothetical protein